MADLREVLRLYPAVRAYVGEGRWVRRGDVLAYAPSQDAGAFSTDEFGYRHGTLNGRTFDLGNAFSASPYALALGASQTFGFGLDSNADTLPSQLSSLVGVPVLNISFPEGDLRTLQAAATRISRSAPNPPAFIVCFVGGTASRYTYTRRCDPLFGSPDLASDIPPLAIGSAEESAEFQNLQSFVRHWLGQMADLAAALACPLVLSMESSALQKSALRPEEQACKLGEPRTQLEGDRFALSRLHYAALRAEIIEVATARGARFAAVDEDGLNFIDEFHLTAGSIGLVAAAIAQHAAPRS